MKWRILVLIEDNAFFNFEKDPLEELFTFFVGISRAKVRLLITYCEGRFGGQTRRKISSFYQMLRNAGVREYSIE